MVVFKIFDKDIQTIYQFDTAKLLNEYLKAKSFSILYFKSLFLPCSI